MGRREKKIISVLAMAALIAAMAFPVSAAGSSWRPQDSGIYASHGREFTESVTGTVEKIAGSIGDLFGDVLGLLLSPFVKGMGDAIYSLLILSGCSLDAIIFGRVGGASYMNGDVAMFTFELTSGNIYGTISMFIYNILSGVFLIIMVCVILLRLVSLLLYGHEQKIRPELKKTLGRAVIFTAAVFLMPKVVDLLLYVRDAVLYAIVEEGVGGLSSLLRSDILETAAELETNPVGGLLYLMFGPSGDFSLVNVYRKAAVGSLMNSIMYLATTVLTVYFAFLYVSVALTFGVLMVMFPVCCILDIATGGSRLGDWFTQITGLMLIPVIDAVLLLFPLTLALLDRESGAGPYAFVQFILMMSIVPAREFVRQKLGFGGASGLERAGLSAGLSALRLAMAVKGAAKAAVTENRARDTALRGAEKAAETAESIENGAELKGKAAIEKLQESIDSRFGKEGDAYGIAQETGYVPDDLLSTEAEMEETKTGVTERNVRRYGEAYAARENASTAISRLGTLKKENLQRKKALNEQIGNLQTQKALLSGDREGNAAELLAIDTQIADKKALLTEENAKSEAIGDQLRRFEGIRSDADRALSVLEAAGGNSDLDALRKADESVSLQAYRDNPKALENCSMEKRAELTSEYARFLRETNRKVKVAAFASPALLGMLGAGAASMLGPSGTAWGASAGMELGTLGDNVIEEGELLRRSRALSGKSPLSGSIQQEVSELHAEWSHADPVTGLLSERNRMTAEYGNLLKKNVQNGNGFEEEALFSAGIWHSLTKVPSFDGAGVLSAGVDASFEAAGRLRIDPEENVAQKESRIRTEMQESFRKSLEADPGLSEALQTIRLGSGERKAFLDHAALSMTRGAENFIQSAARTDYATFTEDTVTRYARENTGKAVEWFAERRRGSGAERLLLTGNGRERLEVAAGKAYRAASGTVCRKAFAAYTESERKPVVMEEMRKTFCASLREDTEFKEFLRGEGLDGEETELYLGILSDGFVKASDGYAGRLSENVYAYNVTEEGTGELKKVIPRMIRMSGNTVCETAVKRIMAERSKEITEYADTAYNISIGRLSSDRNLSLCGKEERKERLGEYAASSFRRMLESDSRVGQILDSYSDRYGISREEVLTRMSGRFKGSSELFFENIVSGNIDVLKSVTNTYKAKNRKGETSIHGPYDILKYTAYF